MNVVGFYLTSNDKATLDRWLADVESAFGIPDVNRAMLEYATVVQSPTVPGLYGVSCGVVYLGQTALMVVDQPAGTTLVWVKPEDVSWNPPQVLPPWMR